MKMNELFSKRNVCRQICQCQDPLGSAWPSPRVERERSDLHPATKSQMLNPIFSFDDRKLNGSRHACNCSTAFFVRILGYNSHFEVFALF